MKLSYWTKNLVLNAIYPLLVWVRRTARIIENTQPNSPPESIWRYTRLNEWNNKQFFSFFTFTSVFVFVTLKHTHTRDCSERSKFIRSIHLLVASSHQTKSTSTHISSVCANDGELKRKVKKTRNGKSQWKCYAIVRIRIQSTTVKEWVRKRGRIGGVRERVCARQSVLSHPFRAQKCVLTTTSRSTP